VGAVEKVAVRTGAVDALVTSAVVYPSADPDTVTDSTAPTSDDPGV
jgi:hypothetical protein